MKTARDTPKSSREITLTRILEHAVWDLQTLLWPRKDLPAALSKSEGFDASRLSLEFLETLSNKNYLELGIYRVAGDYVRYDPIVRQNLTEFRRRLLDGLTSSSPGLENYLVWGAPGSGKTGLIEESWASWRDNPGLNFKGINFLRQSQPEVSAELRAFCDGSIRGLCFVDEVDKNPGPSWAGQAMPPYMPDGNRRFPVSFVLAGSTEGSVTSLRRRIASGPPDFPCGDDVMRRVPLVNCAEVPSLDVRDRIIVAASRLLRAGADANRPIQKIESLLLHYFAIASEVRKASDLAHLSRVAVRSSPSHQNEICLSDLLYSRNRAVMDFLRSISQDDWNRTFNRFVDVR